MPKLILAALLALALPLTALYPGAVPWDNNLDYPSGQSVANMSYLNGYNIDRNGFVRVKDGHFQTGRGRINFFGTNLTFDACFPEKATAERLAAQLAGLGVNLVRLHHMDNRDIWGKNRGDFRELDPVQLDKLDYLIFCLKRKGIYVDLNLHVSWQYTNDKNAALYRLIHEEAAFKYGKGLDTFLPDLILKQKNYAAAVLNHPNPYTGLVYKNDPAVALVEINNEDSFYRNMILQGGLDILPADCHGVLDQGFQRFLRQKYPRFSDLRQAWSNGAAADRPVEMPDMLPFQAANHWRVQISDPGKGTIVLQGQEARVHLNNPAKNGFFQLYKTDLSFKKDDDYTAVLDVAAPKGATFRINAMRQNAPYEAAGLNKRFQMTGSRQTFVIPFQATEDLERLGRITLADFDNARDFVIHAVRLYHGKYCRDPLGNVTSFEGIAIPALIDYAAYPGVYQADLCAFFREVELGYWSEMMRYLKKEIGVKAPVTGTQIDYSSPELAELYDYVDVHAYWQHPSFPGNPWDPKNYFVRNVSMVTEAKTNFDRIALCRIHGKPFVVSEYNHPYPNLHTAETPTMLAVVSKLQDYDGIFMFNYLNNLDMDPASYFSHYTKFACKAAYPAAALIFRDPAFAPLAEETVWNVGKDELYGDMQRLKRYINPYVNRLLEKPDELFDVFKTKRVALRLAGEGAAGADKVNFRESGIASGFEWDNSRADYRQNYFKYDAAGAKVYIGWNVRDRYEFKNVSLQIHGAEKRYFQFTVLNQNGPVGQKGDYLVALTGRELYSNVNYYNYDTKEKLDPTQENYRTKIMAVPTAKQNTEFIENYDATLRIKLAQPYRSIAVYAVDAKGEKGANMSFKVVDNVLTADLSRKDGTVIYGIEIGD